MTRLLGTWEASKKAVSDYEYNCGYCGILVGPSMRYACSTTTSQKRETTTYGNILLCPKCNKPTFIRNNPKEHVPGPMVGEKLEHLPQDIENLYNEARSCISVNAYTSSVLSCRKLLMNISVAKGAPPGKKFIEYVNFLDEKHFTPPDSKEWVDHIRKMGNEATHDIPSIEKEDAIELLGFTEMLLRFVYEMPGKMQKYRK